MGSTIIEDGIAQQMVQNFRVAFLALRLCVLGLAGQTFRARHPTLRALESEAATAELTMFALRGKTVSLHAEEKHARNRGEARATKDFNIVSASHLNARMMLRSAYTHALWVAQQKPRPAAPPSNPAPKAGPRRTTAKGRGKFRRKIARSWAWRTWFSERPQGELVSKSRKECRAKVTLTSREPLSHECCAMDVLLLGGLLA